MYTVTIPQIGKLNASTKEALAQRFETLRDLQGFGSSEIGSRWKIKDCNGRDAGALSYNGKVWAI